MPISESENEPKLSVIPTHLDFGTFDASRPSPESGSKEITITNRGGGTLAGRVNPQTPWITINPTAFRCQAGESCTHTVTLKRSAPRSWKPQRFKFDFLFLINSNGGSASLSGEYIATPKNDSAPFSIPWLWVGLSALLVVLAASLVLGLIFVRSKLEDRETRLTHLLYTQGAETEIARLSTTPTLPETATIPVVAEAGATPEPGSLESLATVTPEQPVYTPWPRDEYPNPEQFIINYYSTINYGNYETSWTMLSPQFQQTCCSVGGNDPFTVYSNWWRTIKRVDIISIYLQAWDTNPAVVHVSLRYQTVDERTLDTFNIFYLLADAERKTLVIDKVE